MRYTKHEDYLKSLAIARQERAALLHGLIRERLSTYIAKREVEEIDFTRVTVEDLRDLLRAAPALLKPLIAACNMGKRAIRKELALELDTYRPRLTEAQATLVAQFLLPCLPRMALVETLLALDAYQWVDSEIRKQKGRWEKKFQAELRKLEIDCKKRWFTSDGERFEIDVAYPKTGPIRLAIDVKSIGHPSDKQKRGDEIVNKASHFKQVHPDAVFIALVQYPFDIDREDVEHRLMSGSSNIDEVIFAGDDEESVATAVARIKQHHLSLAKR